MRYILALALLLFGAADASALIPGSLEQAHGI